MFYRVNKEYKSYGSPALTNKVRPIYIKET